MSNRLWPMVALAVAGTACNKSEPAAPVAQTPPPQVTAPAQPAVPASAPAGEAAAPAGNPFSGELTLGEGVTAADLKPTDVLFIMAREGAGEGGPGRLVAVQRHTEVTFPKKFSVGPTDAMVPGSPFTGPFSVTARIDRDGDPMTKTEDDLYAAAAGPVMAGQGTVNLVLKKGMPKDMAPPMPAGHPGMPPTGAAPH